MTTAITTLIDGASAVSSTYAAIIVFRWLRGPTKAEIEAAVWRVMAVVAPMRLDAEMKVDIAERAARAVLKVKYAPKDVAQ